MKQLISTKEVRDAANQKQNAMFLEKSHIITPAARDMAKELGIQFLNEDQKCCTNEGQSRCDRGPEVQHDLKKPEIDIDVDLICMIVIETLKQLRKKSDR